MYELKGKRIMVAGGAGFVGSAVIRELLLQDAQVVSFDNYLHGVPQNVEGLQGPLTIINGDVLDMSSFLAAVQENRIDFLIDCVGDTYVPTAYFKPQRFFDVNLRGTLNCLMVARLCGLERVLYVSSTEVYGAHEFDQVSEEAPLNPLNTYAVSKLAADRLCFTFHVEHKTPVIIARIFNCYGPRETHSYIVPEIIWQLHKSNVLYLGNLEAARDLTYVHDTARALIALLRSNMPHGEVVNVGSDTSFSIKWLAQTIATEMGRKDLEIRHDPKRLRRLDIQKFRCNNAKLRRYTDWFPEVDIHNGLRKTIAWFRENNNQWNWKASVDESTIDPAG